MILLGVAHPAGGNAGAGRRLHLRGVLVHRVSTSFANPAVTLARALTDTFAGIRPADVPGFIAAQLLGAVLALGVAGLLRDRVPARGGT